MPSLPYWLSPGDDRPPAEIDDEVAEELRLHLDLLAEERMRQGVTPDLAKQQAAERFGDFDTLLRRCRLEKQGDLPMLKRIQAVLIGVLVLFVGLLCWRDYVSTFEIAEYRTMTTKLLVTIQSDLAEMRGELQLAEEAAASDGLQAGSPFAMAREFIQTGPAPSPTLTVYNSQREAIPNTRLRFSLAHSRGAEMSLYDASDASGRCTIHVPDESWVVKSIHAYARGYALETSVFVSQVVPGLMTDPGPMEVVLSPAVPIKLRVIKGDGEPASLLSVVPVARVDLRDRTHEAPEDSQFLWQQTDESGVVELDWLQPGDLATIRLKERGQPLKDAESIEFEVPSDPSKVVSIKLKETNDGFGDGFGGGEYRGFGGEYAGGYGGVVGDGKSYEVDLIDKQKPQETDEPKSE